MMSGSGCINLMDIKIADDLHLSQEALPQTLTASVQNGRLIFMVTHQTSPVTLIFDDGHQEKFRFFLYKSFHHPLILEYPWLINHNPRINWATGRVIWWG